MLLMAILRLTLLAQAHPDNATAAMGEWGWLANLTALAAVIVLFSYVTIYRDPKQRREEAADRRETQASFLTQLEKTNAQFERQADKARDQSIRLASSGHEALNKLSDAISEMRAEMGQLVRSVDHLQLPDEVVSITRPAVAINRPKAAGGSQ